MDKHYLFVSKEPLNKEKIEELLKNLCKTDAFCYFDDFSGEFIGDSFLYEIIDSSLSNLVAEYGSSISILASHDNSEFSLSLLKETILYFPNQIVFPSDLVMKEMSFGDYRSYPKIKEMFSKVDYEILETVGTYLRCGLDGLGAARRLGIHRNTFNYRMSKFIELTNLDIRDYHNALLLELFFQLIS